MKPAGEPHNYDLVITNNAAPTDADDEDDIDRLRTDGEDERRPRPRPLMGPGLISALCARVPLSF